VLPTHINNIFLSSVDIFGLQETSFTPPSLSSLRQKGRQPISKIEKDCYWPLSVVRNSQGKNYQVLRIIYYSQHHQQTIYIYIYVYLPTTFTHSDFLSGQTSLLKILEDDFKRWVFFLIKKKILSAFLS
jgi:hypothetical protein